MKSTRIPVILVVALCLIGRVSADGELAYYKFDRDASDSSGNQVDGTLVGDSSIFFDDERGGVLSLDGDGDYVYCTTGGTEGVFNLTGPITVAAWIKVGVFDRDWQAIVTKGDTAWRLARDENRNGLEFACTGVYFLRGDTNVNDGQWHHAAGIYDGSKISLYIDGVLDTSAAASGNIATNTEVLRIGSNSQEPGREWNGQIDDVRIYNRALSEAEISELAVPLVGFDYQGRLLNANDPADGLYDFEFDLYDEPSGGTKQGGTICSYDLDVIEGYFTATLHFPSSVFLGNDLWLDIRVRPGDGNDTDDFVILSPRQKVRPTPYAIYALNAGADSDWMVSKNNMHSMVTGNVGIGTTNPAQKLEINQGNLLVRGLDGFNSNGEEGVLYLGNTPHYMKAVYGYGLKIGTYGAEDAVSIRQYTGNVGIGTTEPGTRLDVTSSDAAAATIGADATTASGIHAIAMGANADANSHYSIAMGTGTRTDGWYSTAIGTDITVSGKRSVGIGIGSSQANISSDNVMAVMGGNVGIGTTSPAAKLDVTKTDSGGAAIYGKVTATGTNTFGKGGHFTSSAHQGEGVYGEASGSQGIGVYGKATNGGRGVQGVAENGGTGVYGNATSSGLAGHFDGRSLFDGDLKVSGNLIVEGSYQGNIGQGGAPFPRPAYDTGWYEVQYSEMEFVHNLGGNVDNYVVDMQVRSHLGTTNFTIGGDKYVWDVNPETGECLLIQDGAWWHNLTNVLIKVSNSSGYITHVRIRIWVYE